MKDVIGFEGLYSVDEAGNVYSKDRIVNHNCGGLAVKKGKRLQPETTGCGYLRVLLIDREGKRSHLSVHRIVAKAYIPNPNNLPQVNHKDGNKRNNHISNLEWCTSQQNNVHALENGLRTGRKRGKSIIINGMCFSSIAAAARHFGVSRYLAKKMGSNDYPGREYACGEIPEAEAHQ